jgi:hypothetical protein
LSFVFCLLSLSLSLSLSLGVLMAWYLQDKLWAGRRRTLSGAFVFGGSVLLIQALPSVGDSLQVALTIIGKAGVAGAFNVLYVFSGELFPTSVRATALGCFAFVGRLGGILAPLAVSAGGVTVAIVIFGCAALVAGCLSFMLPETLGEDLPDLAPIEWDNIALEMAVIQHHENEKATLL